MWGGVLPAFEVAVRIAERGLREPAYFVASSQVAPHEGPHGRFLDLSDQQLAEEIRTLLRATRPDAEPMPEMIELIQEVLVADVEANRRYRKPTAVALGCPILAIGWDRNVEVP